MCGDNVPLDTAPAMEICMESLLKCHQREGAGGVMGNTLKQYGYLCNQTNQLFCSIPWLWGILTQLHKMSGHGEYDEKNRVNSNNVSTTSETLNQWSLLCVKQWNLYTEPLLHPNEASENVRQINVTVTVGKLKSAAYMENCFSLASMLRCLIHILVSADPMSLVPPERQQNTVCTSNM